MGDSPYKYTSLADRPLLGPHEILIKMIGRILIIFILIGYC